MPDKPTCSIPDCPTTAIKRGWCGKHYQRWKAHGDALFSHWDIPYEDRFWPKVKRTETCWVWTGGTSHLGYGTFLYKGRHIGAHRVAWELTYGPIPAGMQVLHRCDNPPCVRPDHLFLGTQRDNIRDMMTKGRQHMRFMVRARPDQLPRGTNVHNARLTENQVRAIRISTWSSTILAAQYGVSNSTIRAARSGRNWQHVQ